MAIPGCWCTNRMVKLAFETLGVVHFKIRSDGLMIYIPVERFKINGCFIRYIIV